MPKDAAFWQFLFLIFCKMHDERRVLRYNTRYNAQYTGGGDEALIDGISGGDDFRTGEWQGFEGRNLDVVIDLGKKQKIKVAKSKSIEGAFV